MGRRLKGRGSYGKVLLDVDSRSIKSRVDLGNEGTDLMGRSRSVGGDAGSIRHAYRNGLASFQLDDFFPRLQFHGRAGVVEEGELDVLCLSEHRPDR